MLRISIQVVATTFSEFSKHTLFENNNFAKEIFITAMSFKVILLTMNSTNQKHA